MRECTRLEFIYHTLFTTLGNNPVKVLFSMGLSNDTIDTIYRHMNIYECVTRVTLMK